MRVAAIAIVGVLCSAHPALAAHAVTGGSMSWLTDGVATVQNAFLAVGWCLVLAGVGWGGIHFLEHREDWFGGVKRVGGGVAAGAVMMHASDIASLGAAGAIVHNLFR